MACAEWAGGATRRNVSRAPKIRMPCEGRQQRGTVPDHDEAADHRTDRHDPSSLQQPIGTPEEIDGDVAPADGRDGVIEVDPSARPPAMSAAPSRHGNYRATLATSAANGDCRQRFCPDSRHADHPVPCRDPAQVCRTVRSGRQHGSIHRVHPYGPTIQQSRRAPLTRYLPPLARSHFAGKVKSAANAKSTNTRSTEGPGPTEWWSMRRAGSAIGSGHRRR